jgi:hypothetical protein
MNLARLLEMGGSLNAIKDTQSRYRIQHRNLLQKICLPGPARGRVKAYWERLASRLFRVPLGYQDETGFHYGAKQARNEAVWPPFW